MLQIDLSEKCATGRLMISIHSSGKIAELLEGHKHGLYLDGEVIAVCMDALFEEVDRSGLWAELQSGSPTAY